MTADACPPTPAPRPRLFLSYSRADREPAARIVTALEAAGYEVWWDALIEGGSTFAKTIAAALEASDAVMVAWSRTSVESNWVLDEAMHGRDRGRLIPVCLDGAEPPLGFRQYQVIDLSRWQGNPDAKEWQATLRAIAALLATPAAPRAAGAAAAAVAPASAPPSTARPAGQKRRRLILGGSAAALVAMGAAGYLTWRGRQPVASSANSVAVLPFRNLSGDPAQDFFSDGLAEELRIALSRNPLLRVAAQASSNVFRDRHESVQAMASQLDVAYLLDASVRRADNAVRIGVSLIDAATGFNRWSQVFERTMNDIFAVQAEIANSVATTLAAQIPTLRSDIGGTGNVQAFDAYLRGRALYEQDAGEQTDRAALRLFEAAIAADPDYALAHAARAGSLVAIGGQYAPADQLPAVYDAAEAAAKRAIELAPDLAAAHSALAKVLFGARLKVREARAPYERMYALGKGDANILSSFAFYSAMTGREAEALAATTRAVTLDPLNAVAFRINGSVQYAGRRYADAMAPLQHALSLNPKISDAHAMIGDVFLQTGRPADARAAYLLEPSDSLRLTGLAVVERVLKNDKAAQDANAKLLAQLGDSALYQQAQILSQWGDRDGAITRLVQARKVGDQGLMYVHTDPLLDPLRSDGRFAQLEMALGFA